MHSTETVLAMNSRCMHSIWRRIWQETINLIWQSRGVWDSSWSLLMRWPTQWQWRRVPERDGNRQESQRDLRLFGMNTYQIDRVIRQHVRRFDGVFACDRLPTKPRLMVCNTDPSDMTGEHWMTTVVTENISTRSDVHPHAYLSVTWTNIVANGFTIVNSYRVSPVDSADIIVLAFAYFETAIWICVVFYAILLAILVLTMLSCMNWYVVCSSIVRRYVTNKRVKHILCLLLCVLHRQTNIQTAIILIDYTSIKHGVTSWWLFSNNRQGLVGSGYNHCRACKLLYQRWHSSASANLSLNITIGFKVQTSTVVVPWENYIVRTYNEVKDRASQTVEVYVQ